MNSPLSLTAALQWAWDRSPASAKNDPLLIRRIRDEGKRFMQAPEQELLERITELRELVVSGVSTKRHEILVPAFALACEAARRVLKIDLYNVQLLAGLALARGGIAEMQTGEGKTFAALLPTVLHALCGRGVHVMTVNAYLAERDFELLAPVYHMLGLTAGKIDAQCTPESKRTAYECDITYGMGCEFGFDYLRDQLALMSVREPKLGERFRGRLRGVSPAPPLCMQRELYAAIVDEADSVMIDEATTPLILAVGGDQPAANAEVYLRAKEAASKLNYGDHFCVKESQDFLQLTPQGTKYLTDHPESIPKQGLRRPWQAYVEQALRAVHLYRRDVHYICQDGEIQLVDQGTGRIFVDRTWRDGLHQAVQAKESVVITTENKSMARISRQRYFRRYPHLCGMTGTAQGSERELKSLYGLNVTVIPPHRPCLRRKLPLRAFANGASKYREMVNEIARIHATGQPILVGTAAIEISEYLATLLQQRNVPFQLLNGKQDAEEAEVVAVAGQVNAVTIATNMAGRGTDIKLSPAAAGAGGLHVIVAEPQESIRVDRQLIGRAARQGDPGSCQVFVAADDPLLERHNRDLARLLGNRAETNGEIAELRDFEQGIAHTQRKTEAAKARLREDMFAHDDWLERILGELA